MGRRYLPIDFRIAYSGIIGFATRAIRKFPKGNRIMTDRLLFSGRYNSVASAEGIRVDERFQ